MICLAVALAVAMIWVVSAAIVIVRRSIYVELGSCADRVGLKVVAQAQEDNDCRWSTESWTQRNTDR